MAWGAMGWPGSGRHRRRSTAERPRTIVFISPSETFTVLAGEIEATFRGKKTVVRAGETLHIPANAPHNFTNASNQPARLLCTCPPAGQEDFFAQVGVSVPGRTTPPPKPDKAALAEFVRRAKDLAPQYRTELLGP